jgi:hypothetical protein
MRTALAILACSALTVVSGCSGRSSFLSGGPTVGQMKTSLAHLEYENAQMKRDLAKVRRESREMEDRLVQQEQDNGELLARLDDARNLIRERGLDPAERAASGRGGARDLPDDGGGVKALPAGESTRKRRRTPFARIPGQFTPAAPDRGQEGEEEGLGLPQPVTAPSSGADPPGLGIDDDLDHHTYYNGPLRWTPIAGGTSDPGSRVR